MIIAGIVIVFISCIIYISLESDKMLLLVGNISGIVVDFIGAIFIKMYTQNLEAAVKFHARFAESNNLLLANTIANKIENVDLREQRYQIFLRKLSWSNNLTRMNNVIIYK